MCDNFCRSGKSRSGEPGTFCAFEDCHGCAKNFDCLRYQNVAESAQATTPHVNLGNTNESNPRLLKILFVLDGLKLPDSHITRSSVELRERSQVSAAEQLLWLGLISAPDHVGILLIIGMVHVVICTQTCATSTHSMYAVALTPDRDSAGGLRCFRIAPSPLPVCHRRRQPSQEAQMLVPLHQAWVELGQAWLSHHLQYSPILVLRHPIQHDAVDGHD
jgi:hypothetical protein